MIETLIVSPGHTLPVEARATEPGDPGAADGGWGGDYAAAAYAFHTFGRWDDWLEQHFDSTRALTYSVLWGCVSYISQTIASLGWHQYERQERGQKKVPLDDPVSWLLDMQACPECNAFDWRQTMLKDALLWGNGYAEIERTGGGRPYWLWRLEPGRVHPERDDDGGLYYRVRNDQSGGGDTALDPANVFHLKGLSPDGLVGYSVVQMARRSIELGLSEEQFGATFFRKGPMPGGILEIPGAVKKTERDEMRESFQKTYGGTRNAGKVVVLTGGAKFSAMSMPNDDAQWIEGRTFQAEEIARWFRVPPHKVGLLNRATFSNIEQQSIEAVQDCLLPWCRRLESEADVKLFGRNNRGRRYTRLNLDGLLRGDSATQTTTVTQKVASGLMMINEGREYFDLNPVPDGDTLLVQGAMVPLERVLEEPAPARAPNPFGSPGQDAGQPGPADQADVAAAVRRVFGSLFAEVYGRLLRVEADKAKRAQNKGQLRQWVQEYYRNGSEAHAAQSLRPVVEAFLLATGRPADAGRLSARLAAQHIARSLADPPREPTGPRAARQAEEHVDWLWACGGPGSGVPGPCPGEKDAPAPGQRGTGSEQLHGEAEKAAKGWGEWAKELPGRVLQAAADKIANKYAGLKERYGKGLALAIMGAGIAATPIPVPGTTFIAVAPLIAAGELYRALRGGGKGAKNLRAADEPPPEGLTDEEITRLGKEWLAEILKEWEKDDLPKLGEDDNA